MSTLAEHLERLEVWLRSLAGAPHWSAARGVEAGSIQHGPVDMIPRGARSTVGAYGARFDTHFAAGYRWINLSGLGVEDETLLVSIELPCNAGGVPFGRTSINLSGPPLDMKTGAPIWHLGTRIRLVH